MEVRPIERTEAARWDQMVEDSPEGTLFHTHAWLFASPWRPKLYGVFDNNHLLGGFATCQRHGRYSPARAAQPSFTPYLGLITIPDSSKPVAEMSRKKEIASLVAESIKKDFAEIEVRFAPGVLDMQPFIWSGYQINVRYTYIVDVADLEKTWREMEQTRRNDIRKAQRADLVVKQGIEVNALLGIIETTLRRQGSWSPDFPSIIGAYDRSLSAVGRRETFGVFDPTGDLLAAAYMAWDNKRSYYLLGGYKTDKYRGAPALALWESMKYTQATLGLSDFDLEGSMIPGVERFFRKFGGRLVPTFTATWVRPMIRHCYALRSTLGFVSRCLRRAYS